MKIQTQTNDQLAQLCELIEPIRIAMLTTMGDDEALTSRPMSVLEVDSQGKFWFYTSMSSQKVKHLHPMNLGFADMDRSTYVSIAGSGVLVHDTARIRALWTPFAKPWFPMGPESADLALLEFTPDIAEYWDAPNSKMVRLFAVAASVVTGRPVAMGDHAVLTGLAAN